MDLGLTIFATDQSMDIVELAREAEARGFTSLWTPEHTWHLIRNFAVAEPLLEVPRGGVVLDAGSGYSWTTEWMLRSGYEPIGMDICRTYLEIAVARIGVNRWRALHRWTALVWLLSLVHAIGEGTDRGRKRPGPSTD